MTVLTSWSSIAALALLASSPGDALRPSRSTGAIATGRAHRTGLLHDGEHLELGDRGNGESGTREEQRGQNTEAREPIARAGAVRHVENSDVPMLADGRTAVGGTNRHRISEANRDLAHVLAAVSCQHERATGFAALDRLADRQVAEGRERALPHSSTIWSARTTL